MKKLIVITILSIISFVEAVMIYVKSKHECPYIACELSHYTPIYRHTDPIIIPPEILYHIKNVNLKVSHNKLYVVIDERKFEVTKDLEGLRIVGRSIEVVTTEPRFYVDTLFFNMKKKKP